MAAIHSNQALYTPSYFSSTYDFEKIRTLRFDRSNNNIHAFNEEFLDNFCVDGCENGDIIYLSKELYPVMANQDFVFLLLVRHFNMNIITIIREVLAYLECI